MKKALGTLIIAIIILLLPSAIVYKLHTIQASHTFVASTYSKYCYYSGKEPVTMLYKQYYETIDACGKPLKQ